MELQPAGGINRKISGKDRPIMSTIKGSVGQNGDNLERDVRVVQQLLNRQDLAPLTKIKEDGQIDSKSIEAIRHFQTRYLGMNSPDGRVDTNSRTIRKLTNKCNQRPNSENP